MESEIDTELGLSQYLPTGTEIGIALSTQQSWSDLYSEDLFESRLGMSVTQALLKGAGLGYNLATLRQARWGVLRDGGLSRHPLASARRPGRMWA